MNIFLISIAAFFSTFLGGVFALKLKHKLHLIMGFTAGVLLAVVAFDILPEIISQVNEFGFDPMGPMIALVVGFLIFHIFEKVLMIHHAHEEDYAAHKHPHVGVMSAVALAGHSFMDGVGIGLGFQINPTVGFLVALAVISHDFTDGMNTITLMLSSNNTSKKSKIFLLVDSLAPVAGALSTLFFSVPPYFLVLYLGFFAGFLLYISTSDILPEAHSKNSSLRLVGLTVLGAGFIYIITRIMGGLG
jgi:zinc transporter ZupT